MLLWMIIAVVGWANFQFARWVATLFRLPVQGRIARAVPSARVSAALLIIVAAIGFFVWNQKAKVYPFTLLHAAILAVCVVAGYQSVQARQKSLQDEINSLSQGVSSVFAQPLSSEERLKALLAVALRDEVIGSKVEVGVFVRGRDGMPIGSIKVVGDTLMDDPAFPKASRTSSEEKIDILLEEIGFALLAKFGEDVMPPQAKEHLSQRDLRNLRESSERTRALLDADAIDWRDVDEAVFRISEARLRRGVHAAELTTMEQRVRAGRHS
jgi:hypothetical protein